MAGAAFQVFLKALGQFQGFEGGVKFNFPRSEFGGGGAFADAGYGNPAYKGVSCAAKEGIS